MKGIMIQGTSSDVGKSVICTALCRIFSRRKLRVAPFKSQNMSNNSYVTLDGSEIGRAQGIQAEAAEVEASVYMNPILLKPRSDRDSEIVRFGKVYQTLSGRAYREQFYEKGLETIQIALAKLEEEFDYVVIEGAGSPVEMNLNDRELVNMKVAELADVPVVLVTDIDRGGVFASIAGTLQLLNDAERSRVVGVIINKFRGDPTLFESGRTWIEEHLGIPVLAVLPHLPNLSIEGEDSLSMKTSFLSKPLNKQVLDIAVIDLPYISNYTDLEPFRHEDDVSIRFVQAHGNLGEPDAIIIPGTKSTFHDLTAIKKSGLFEAIQAYMQKNGTIIGICGGYQMLGETLIDYAGTDTGIKGNRTDGLGIVSLETMFEDKKTTIRSTGCILNPKELLGEQIEGFEIHLGQTTRLSTDIKPFLKVNGDEEGVCLKNGRVIGTYFHHLFHNDQWRTWWLNELRERKGWCKQPVKPFTLTRSKAYDRLADAVERELDVELLLEKLDEWEIIKQ
ncbi:cobyric acid synthase [Halalkalibacter urbisdiaboli]|uniref:cobyric acid synthase n=1 Tax=Halalkalibacter urbisdiaboli TaxID=1960589 RepID=UPI000B4480CA|nr:cobyric acid synthase [Halalkalibacter urbisdiaboli]